MVVELDETGGRRRRFPWRWLVLLLVAAGAAWWLYGERLGGGPAGPGGRPGMAGLFGAGTATPVRVAEVQSGVMPHVLRAIGTAVPIATVTVRSRVDGELLSLGFEDGARVEQGQVLATIDPRSYQIALDQALARQRQNQATLVNARRELQRYRVLMKQDAVARQQLESQDALVKQLEAGAAADQAAVDEAQLRLGYTEVVSPVTGRAGLRRVDVGNLVSAGGTDGLVVVTQMQPMAVDFAIPQADLPAVLVQRRQGVAIPVDMRDRDDATVLATGVLAAIDNQVDVGTGTVRLRARVTNDDEVLFPNQFVQVRVRVSEETGLIVPATAVQQGSAGPFVYVLEGADRVRLQRIVTGRTDGERTQVTQGLVAGDQVVVQGIDRLREGARVEVITGDPATAQPSARPNRPGPGGGRPAGGPAEPASRPVDTGAPGAAPAPATATAPSANAPAGSTP